MVNHAGGGPGRLLIDPVACDGVGMCAHLAPSLIELDPWGYPVIPTETVDGADARAAGRAVRGCPKLALRFVPSTDPDRSLRGDPPTVSTRTGLTRTN